MLKLAMVPVIASLLTLSACSSSEREHPRHPIDGATTRPSGTGGEPAAKGVQTLTGTLRGNIAATGAAGTKGWILAGDQAVGGMALDVSKVADRAKELDGKRVTVTGHMSEQMLATAGRTHVLIVDSIEPAAEPAH